MQSRVLRPTEHGPVMRRSKALGQLTGTGVVAHESPSWLGDLHARLLHLSTHALTGHQPTQGRPWSCTGWGVKDATFRRMTAALVALGLLWAQHAPGAQVPAAPVRFTVAASGDFLIHEPVAAQALADGGGKRYAFAPMFAAIRKRIAGADLAICHVETPLVPGPVRGYPSFRTPPGLAGGIKATGW